MRVQRPREEVQRFLPHIAGIFPHDALRFDAYGGRAVYLSLPDNVVPEPLDLTHIRAHSFHGTDMKTDEQYLVAQLVLELGIFENVYIHTGRWPKTEDSAEELAMFEGAPEEYEEQEELYELNESAD